jgi:hypothetical protein
MRYFNVATDPSTGTPLWKSVAHLTLEERGEKQTAPGYSQLEVVQ